MRILARPHPENDNHADVTDVPPKSILPDDERGIGSIMVGINGRTDRRFYVPAVGSFWRPPADVEAAISRGNRKTRQATHEVAS